MPRSRRDGPAWRMAGWYRGAKQKPMPASATHAATPSGAELDRHAERFEEVGGTTRGGGGPVPVLAHAAPAPATTSAARVETLMVCARSPPVPTTSITGPLTSMSTWVAASNIASTIPTSSSTSSPFIRSATTNAAICAGLAAPSSTSAMVGPRLVLAEGAPIHELAEDDRPPTVFRKAEISHAANLPVGRYEARRRCRRMRRRSFSVAPPQTPSFSRPWRANSRHVSCTAHSVHTIFATAASSSVAG